MHQLDWPEFSWYCGSSLIIQHFYKCIILPNDVLTHLHSTFGLYSKLKIIKLVVLEIVSLWWYMEELSINCDLLSITSSFEISLWEKQIVQLSNDSNLDKEWYFPPIERSICLTWRSIHKLVTDIPKMCCHFTLLALFIFPKPKCKLGRTLRDL